MPRNYQTANPVQFQRLPNLTRSDTWTMDFLRSAKIGHIAHSRGDQPFVTPTNFWFDDANHRIIFHSNITGRIRDNLQNNPKVCMEASEYGRFLPANTALEFSVQYRSVMVFGTVKLIEDPSEKAEVLYNLINKYFPYMIPGKEYRPITDQELTRTSVYALLIESWSGKENWEEKAEELPDWPILPDHIK